MKAKRTRAERATKDWWFASYRGCGCSVDAERKKDILVYCAKHGSSLYECFKSPVHKIVRRALSEKVKP